MREVRLLTLVALLGALFLGFSGCKKGTEEKNGQGVTEEKIVGQWVTETNIVGGIETPGLKGIFAGTRTFKKGGEYLFESELNKSISSKGKWELSGDQLKISLLNELTNEYDKPTVYTVTVLEKNRIKLMENSKKGMILKRK